VKIYLNSSELFLLEERIHELEKQVLSLDENSACGTISDLEDKVALTVAMVTHRDNQVRIETLFYYFLCFLLSIGNVCLYVKKLFIMLHSSSYSMSALVAPHTCRATIGGRAFPVAAASVWTVCRVSFSIVITTSFPQ